MALLRTDSIAHARAALILLDQHAEIMLNGHFKSLFRAGDGKGSLAGRPYKRGERQKLRDFRIKVDAAAGVGPLGQGVTTVLDADDAACLKLAHRHRNAAYHLDQHNPGVLELICLLQLRSVCHLLPATMENISISFAGKDLPEALVRHGVEVQDMSGLHSAIELPGAAQQVADGITAELELPLVGVKGALADDLLDRAGAVEPGSVSRSNPSFQGRWLGGHGMLGRRRVGVPARGPTLCDGGGTRCRIGAGL